jgi:hypothetical protein
VGNLGSFCQKLRFGCIFILHQFQVATPEPLRGHGMWLIAMRVSVAFIAFEPIKVTCGEAQGVKLIPQWRALALRRLQFDAACTFGSACTFSIRCAGGGAAEQLLDQRDAFGLHAAQNGRALADDQSLLPEP